MQRLGAAITAAIALMWCGAAVAEVNGAAMAAQCTSTGAFGVSFGAEAPAGQRGLGMRMMNSQFVTLDAAHAPFNQAEVVVTHRSRLVHTITGIARFDSEEEAGAAYDAALDAFDQDQRFASQASEYEDSVTYYSGPPEAASGFRAEVSLMGRELSLFCVDAALFQRTMDEIAGRDVTADSPQPAPPQLALPAALPAGVCEASDARAAFVADFYGRMEDIMAYGSEAARYNETLMHWKSRQMIAQGLWTEEDSSQFGLRLLGDPQFARHTETSMSAVLGMMGALMEFESGVDEPARCASAQRALSLARQMVQSTEAQWTYMSQAYGAEAQRRGGSID
ncbi:MAG TPA: hypothetical protein VEA80_03840 [Vitreimonas sp.]|uniref:hypothetical protein n=1 Tax=Vitreimonas sp. TaxID=3069702 RepID=UPI002D377DC1|nr:hypothetical protein [Vitreimonas sp.]HYD86581.1 hypothetical protein [Vitreimonas sp.]